MRNAGFVLGLMASVSVSAGSPPADDVGMTMRIESTNDPAFRLGTHAVLAFDVTRHGPLQAGDFSIAASEPVYVDGRRRVQLSPVDGASCPLIDVMGITSPPLLPYGLQGPELPVDATITCRVALTVLATPATNAFEFHLFGASGAGPDPDPGDNTIILPMADGEVPRSIPARSPMTSAGLAAALLLAAYAGLRARRLQR